MSQCFKLVNGGQVDKVIVFDSLPESLMRGVRTWPCEGFPRAWARWLNEIGSKRIVYKNETRRIGSKEYLSRDNTTGVIYKLDGDYEFKNTPEGLEPCFFILDYVDLNKDRDKWREISEYVRLNVPHGTQLKERIEDMAVKLAADSYRQLEIEPEDIPVLNVANNTVVVLKDNDIIKENDKTIIQELPKKRRGRPKKALAEV